MNHSRTRKLIGWLCTILLFVVCCANQELPTKINEKDQPQEVEPLLTPVDLTYKNLRGEWLWGPNYAARDTIGYYSAIFHFGKDSLSSIYMGRQWLGGFGSWDVSYVINDPYMGIRGTSTSGSMRQFTDACAYFYKVALYDTSLVMNEIDIFFINEKLRLTDRKPESGEAVMRIGVGESVLTMPSGEFSNLLEALKDENIDDDTQAIDHTFVFRRIGR